MMAQSIGSVLSGTTYPSDDPEMLAVEADYAAREAQLQEEIDSIESSHPGYDEYRYDLGGTGERPTMPLWFWRTMDSTPTSSWNLTSGKEAADEALFSGTGNHSPL